MDPTFQFLTGFSTNLESSIKEYIIECKKEINTTTSNISSTFKISPVQKLQIANQRLQFYNIAVENIQKLKNLKANLLLDTYNLNLVKEIRSIETGLFQALRILCCDMQKSDKNENATTIIHDACDWKDNSEFVVNAKALLGDIKQLPNLTELEQINYFEKKCLKLYAQLYIQQSNNNIKASTILLYTLLDLYNVVHGPYIMDELEEIPLEIFNDPLYKKICTIQLAITKIEDDLDEEQSH